MLKRGKSVLYVIYRDAKLRVAKSVFHEVEILSQINATRLSLSIMKRPLSLLLTINPASLNVYAPTTE